MGENQFQEGTGKQKRQYLHLLFKLVKMMFDLSRYICSLGAQRCVRNYSRQCPI